MTCGARHGNHQRIVTQPRFTRTPRREVRHRVGPADANGARIRGLPAIAATAHPVIGVAQRDAADAVVARKRYGALHTRVIVQVAGPAPAIPSLKRAVSRYQLRLGLNIHDAIPNSFNESWKPIYTVRVD